VTQLFTREYWETFDQAIIGDQFKLHEKAVETVDLDNPNVTVTITDKAVKVYPTGMFGYFDAYVLQNLKKIFENLDNLAKVSSLYEGFCE